MASPTSTFKLQMLTGAIGSKREARRIMEKYAPDLPVEELHAKYLEEQRQVETPTPTSTKRDLAFVMRTMMFSCMPMEPYKPKRGESKYWIKRFQLWKFNKIVEGSITYSSHEEDIDIVYGSLDRMVLTFLSSLAVKKRSGTLIFASTTDLLEQLGMNTTSGFASLRASLERLQACGISLKLDTEDERVLSKRGIIADLSLPKKDSRMPAKIILDATYVKSLLEEPFPVPWEYLAPFSKKPMGWDLALFLAARVAGCRTPTRIPLYSKDDRALTLLKQFSSKDTNTTRWTKTINGYLFTIKEYWTDLNATIEGRFLVIAPSKYMVEYTGLQTAMLPSFVMDGEEDVPHTLFDADIPDDLEAS